MDNSGLIRQWLSRPLCRRYAVVVANSAAVAVCDERGCARYEVQWAIGALASGELECLGAWQSLAGATGISQPAYADLRNRGAEFINVLLDAGDATRLVAAFPATQCLKSVEQAVGTAATNLPSHRRQEMVGELRRAVGYSYDISERAAGAGLQFSDLGERYPKVVALWGEALARSKAVAKLSEPMQALVRSADRTAAEVSQRLVRDIQRHGPFDDPDAALDFVSGALVRAERRLDRERAAASASREASPLVRRVAETISKGAVGVPTLA